LAAEAAGSAANKISSQRACAAETIDLGSSIVLHRLTTGFIAVLTSETFAFKSAGRTALRLLLAGASIAHALATTRAAAADAARPNIVLIVADDVGYADVGFQGCKDIPTPHIDSIASGGVRFTDGYVPAPVCGPSRAALLTARYQQRFGYEFNPAQKQPGDLAEGGLPSTERTLADAFKEVGYRTGAVGKWHLGNTKQYWPLQRGFDYYYGFLGANHSYVPEKNAAPIFRNNKKVEAPAHLTTAFGDEAAKFIQRQKDNPFFLYLAFNAAHTPLQPDKEHLARFSNIADPKRRAYAGLVSGMDDAVGQVLDAVRSSGKESNTLVVFYSDNGSPQDANGGSNAPLHGDKLELWEGGIRIPMAMQWKGKLPAGSVYRQPVISMDLAVTALAAAGAKLGATDHPIDGVDLVPYITGQNNAAPHDALFWRFGTQHAVRQGDWKLVQFEKQSAQLYDLKADIGEKKDLAEKHPEIVDRLHALYVKWDAQMIDPLWKRQRMEVRPLTSRPTAAEQAG
jgi:arylsulfatase A-like enzyme